MGLFKDCGCGCDGKKQEKKLLISIMAGLLFFIIANPDTFRLMRRILGNWVAGPNGCPTTKGLMLHTVVYILISWGMMNVNNEAYTIPIMGGMKQPESEPKPEPRPELKPMPKMKSLPERPVRMADMPTPTPGKMDIVGFTDSGASFGHMDINEGIDLPARMREKSTPGKMDIANFTDSGASFGNNLPARMSNKESTFCACTDGSEVTISR